MENIAKLVLMVFSIGSISFGGGWSVIGILHDRLVDGGYLSDHEFARMISMSQLVPGPVALNTTSLVGFQEGGILVALLSMFAVVLPGSIVLFFGRLVLKKAWVDQKILIASLGLASLALLLFTLFRLTLNPIVDWWMIGLAAIVCYIVTFTKVPSILVVLGGILIGIGISFI